MCEIKPLEICDDFREIQNAFEKLKFQKLEYDRLKLKPYKPYLECEWVLDEPCEMKFANKAEYDETKAMIEFCTNYEPELFQTFYKWFRKERKVN